jgi:hypothetical protein
MSQVEAEWPCREPGVRLFVELPFCLAEAVLTGEPGGRSLSSLEVSFASFSVNEVNPVTIKWMATVYSREQPRFFAEEPVASYRFALWFVVALEQIWMCFSPSPGRGRLPMSLRSPMSSLRGLIKALRGDAPIREPKSVSSRQSMDPGGGGQLANEPRGVDAHLVQKSQRGVLGIVVAIVVIQALLLGWIAYTSSPVIDEVGHLTAGIYALETGQFHLYRVNPPLVKCTAALAAFLGRPILSWNSVTDTSDQRPEFQVGRDFLILNGADAYWYYTAARLLCIPYVLLGGIVCFLWARQIYGPASGIVALALWCFCPAVLGWGATITPDATCASMAVSAVFALECWLRVPGWRRAFVAGLVLGLALLTKLTLVICLPLWPAIFVAWNSLTGRQTLRCMSNWFQLAAILLTATYVVNAGYGFEGSLTPLGKIHFISVPLAGSEAVALGGIGGNRFKSSWLGRLPVPLPVNYIRGADTQKNSFERGVHSYLFGKWSDRGWWYYYLAAGMLKVPCGTWLLVLLSLVASLTDWRGARGDWYVRAANTMVVLLPAIAIGAFVSSQYGISRNFRYGLPCLPFIYIYASQVFRNRRQGSGGHPPLVVLGGLAVVWSMVSSVSIYPHCLSYFNEMAGGPRGGHRFLLDLNVDCGQDLFRIKEWAASHPQAKPLTVVQTRTGFVVATDVGLEVPSVVHYRHQTAAKGPGISRSGTSTLVPEPGWYAISRHELWNEECDYAFFRDRQPVAWVGYTFPIFFVPE